jgi:prepilin peptidase CpaA
MRVTSVVQNLLFVVFPVAMAYAAASDLLTMTISNRISLILVAGFVLLAPLAGIGLEAFALHWAAAGIVLALTFACFAFGWIGGGDAKLAAVIALWLGWDHAMEFAVIASLLGGLLTLVILSFRGAVLPGVVIRQPWVQRLHDEKSGVPYGLALAASALIVYPETAWVKLAAG